MAGGTEKEQGESNMGWGKEEERQNLMVRGGERISGRKGEGTQEKRLKRGKGKGEGKRGSG